MIYQFVCHCMFFTHYLILAICELLFYMYYLSVFD